MAKQTWLITGCSSGFGEEFVRQLTAQGDHVIATGRNAETRLAHLKDTGASILDLDVTAPQAEIDEKFQHALEVYGTVDVLVNNAGFIQCGAVEEITQEELQLSIDTHLHGPLNLTRSALPHFRERGSGWLVYMTSQSGFVGEPGGTGYCASKFALEGAVESLSKELAWLAPGIKPLIIESGIFNTEVMRNIHHADSRVPFWKPLNDAARIRGQGNYQNPPGNAVEMVSKVIQIVKGTGVAENREIPLRIPFGSDCLAAFREKLQTLQKTCDEWESVAKSTDFAGAGPPLPDIPKNETS
ncbi:hydroxybutyrate dehydrogenase [Annulohypoxylon maeteangense]|uniref:hydroxybutyrate dehydrogenase n=1 Tax=Annulohypoxylon maeteangense TaxID=1927788 RepID=UPI00200801F0|nr:hydroxybutyrate dehydrogenase [Annulohypoxylon maeteangense]KAI0879780.1 hydroxybutyrate dehydrogenase [Annulohypoxylon maeteangense]